MNEKFLDKFFKLYSMTNELYANEMNMPMYLVSSYYKHKYTIYSFEYIDVDLACSIKYNYKSFAHKFSKKDKQNAMHTVLSNDDIKYEIINFLHSIYIKIKSDIDKISEEDVLILNGYYKKLL